MLALIAAAFFGATCINAASGAPDETNVTLDIFGNANMDDLIDAKDITYIEGIIAGANMKTDLADANQDGKVDLADIDRIEQIIDGSESELYYINCFGNASKVKHPLRKIIIAYVNTGEVIRVLGAEDRVVGVDSGGKNSIQSYPRYLSDFMTLPSIGTNDCDAEKILELKPDALFLGSKGNCPDIEPKLKGANIDVVRLETWSKGVQSLMMMAYMLDEVDDAKKYCEWQNEYLNMVKERVSSVPINERPRVFVDRWGNTTVARGSGYSEAIEIAGGINIAANLTGSIRSDGSITSQNTLPPVDTEWVLEKNPDIIIGLALAGGYERDNTSILKARFDEILGTAGFNDVNAGMNNEIFVTDPMTVLGPGNHIGVLYFAKWLYPELFEDLDPEIVHQEFINKFQHADFDLNKHGAFVYPPLNES